MKEQFDNLIDYIKSLNNIRGCITGSSLLGYIEGQKQDVDVFCYDEKAFTELFYALVHNKMFQITDELEQWKADMFRNKPSFTNKHHTGVTTIKFLYNTCIELNLIYKKNNDNCFSVLSSFDMNLICKAYCLQSKQYLDLSGDSTITKIVDWNRWNSQFTSGDVWDGTRILRQFLRIVKYHKRGYNCDKVAEKYLELTENIEKYQSIFKKTDFNERLERTKINTKIIKGVIESWLATHTISDSEVKMIEEAIQNLNN